jgi:hypothetical protein
VKKEDVGRSYHQGRRGSPMLNVKADRFYHAAEAVREKYRDTFPEAMVERAIEWAYESHVESFWKRAQEDAEAIWGSGVRVFSAGRSGGWLVVERLPDVDTWDAIALGKWARFAKWRAGELSYLCGAEAALDTIEANGWLEIDTMRLYRPIKDCPEVPGSLCLIEAIHSPEGPSGSTLYLIRTIPEGRALAVYGDELEPS